MEKRGRRVLVVDDEESIQQTLGVVLPSAGYTVYPVSNGEEALQRVRSVRPDLILLDLSLPDMDGKQVIRHLREGKATPTIGISVRHDESEKVSSVDTGKVRTHYQLIHELWGTTQYQDPVQVETLSLPRVSPVSTFHYLRTSQFENGQNFSFERRLSTFRIIRTSAVTIPILPGVPPVLASIRLLGRPGSYKCR
jgi:CheY-like chemotaxis protein